MAEYKDVTSLKNEIADFKKHINSSNSDYLTGYICALTVTEGMIANLPTADVIEVRHGYWIDCSNGWMCSECKQDNTHDKPYCPNCGAKMDGEREEQE